MPNQTDSLWKRHPEAIERAQKERDSGASWDEIAATFRRDYGEPMGAETLRKHISRYGRAYRKGASIPAGLIEPKDGFAVRERVKNVVIQYPKGWEPRVERVGNTAECVTPVFTKEDTKPAELIQSFGFDPDCWRIVGDIACNKWQGHYPIESPDGLRDYEARWNFQYKFRIREKAANTFQLNSDDLRRFVLSAKPAKQAPPTGEAAFAVCLSDFQLGKSDGDGTEGIVQRFTDRIEMVKDRVRGLRKSGVELGPLYVFGLGDLVEQCKGQYPQQPFAADTNLVDQIMAVQGLIVKALKAWAPLFERVVVPCVGGNHGEANRVDGKNVTDTGDNIDVLIFREAEMILRENQDAFGHISFVIPRTELDLTLDVCGTTTAIAHGHMFESGPTPTKKAENWWKGQAFGEQPAGDARLLLSGHYHSLQVNAGGIKTHIQAPAMEGGSLYWRDKTGQEAAKGLLTLVIGKDRGTFIAGGERMGWDNMQVV
jgi:hypothetical protein